jgi:hypothetical protein
MPFCTQNKDAKSQEKPLNPFMDTNFGFLSPKVLYYTGKRGA